MKKIKILIVGIFLLLTSNSLFAQRYDDVVSSFYNLLAYHDFESAYQLCTGRKWGTLEQFSSTKMYGGVYEIAFNKLTYKKTGDPNMAEAEVDIFVKDSVNGDGRFVQNFLLEKKKGKWLISNISLLLTDRAENGWNLKLVPQTDLSPEFIHGIIIPIYKKQGNEPAIDKSTDTARRDINEPRFFQTPTGVYAVVVAQNEMPYGVAYNGWCDVFVFERKGKEWHMTDYKLHAGGGGMYGNPGAFNKLVRAGNNVTGLALQGGQMHMGDLVSTDDVLAIENGKLYYLFSIVTHHDYGDFESSDSKSVKICDDYTYRFISSDKKNYDLQIVHTSCLGGKNRELGRTLLSFTQDKEERYKIPEKFRFEQ